MGELPDSLELILGNEIYIAKAGSAPGLRNRLLRVAAFQNPEFYKTQAMRLSTYAKPRIIGCAEEHPQHISLPRGCLEDVRELLTDLNIHPVIRDERFSGHPLAANFQGELRTEQKLAAEVMLKHETGVLAATTAFGKTVFAAWLIAQRGVNTLVTEKADGRLLVKCRIGCTNRRCWPRWRSSLVEARDLLGTPTSVRPRPTCNRPRRSSGLGD